MKVGVFLLIPFYTKEQFDTEITQGFLHTLGAFDVRVTFQVPHSRRFLQFHALPAAPVVTSDVTDEAAGRLGIPTLEYVPVDGSTSRTADELSWTYRRLVRPELQQMTSLEDLEGSTVILSMAHIANRPLALRLHGMGIADNLGHEIRIDRLKQLDHSGSNLTQFEGSVHLTAENGWYVGD
jgi:hypothetical protein